ncbi:hypothetical protein [Methanobacterium sp.]|uniref:hypothetical protein n=1 Tax=Methanobacterium sp. TaxID=2164 RepID=UPI0025F7FF97|nr:hypothetical protein [Methanobacterium sp.]
MIRMNHIHPTNLWIKYEALTNGYFFSLKWEDQCLVIKQFSKHENQDEQKIIPSDEEWEDFWHYIDEIKIWDWYEEYRVTCEDSCVEDDEWEVDIIFGDLKVESHGANSYPPTFREFLKAIEELTGIIIEFIQHD